MQLCNEWVLCVGAALLHAQQHTVGRGVSVLLWHGWVRARATARGVTRRAERVSEWRALAVAMLACGCVDCMLKLAGKKPDGNILSKQQWN
jgi:hypothetical protein